MNHVKLRLLVFAAAVPKRKCNRLLDVRNRRSPVEVADLVLALVTAHRLRHPGLRLLQCHRRGATLPRAIRLCGAE